MDWKVVADIAGALGVMSAGILGYQKIKQNRLEKKLELFPNPIRCDDHEHRLQNAEQVSTEVRTGLTDLTGRVDRVQTSVDRLIDMHLKQ